MFEDIIILPAGDLAFQSANGTTFRVTPDLAGLSLRVKAVYQDAHGVPETVFSAPTAPVIDVPRRTAGTAAALVPDITAGRRRASTSSASDLDFILDQIKIAERMRPARTSSPWCRTCACRCGLRTVDGSFNNLVDFGGVDQTEFGAADNVFPRAARPGVPQCGGDDQFGPPGADLTNTTSGFGGRLRSRAPSPT